jgi:molybdopterin converting factor small subunit
MPLVIVEFYGLARQRAGRAEVHLEAATIGSALAAAAAACPNLHAICDNRLSAEYRLSVGGKFFTENLAEPLHDGDALLLLGADAGG